MMASRAQLYGALLLAAVLIYSLSCHFGMFWDNVLFASRMGGHIYENGFFAWMMPDTFDPGHPPFLGFLLAIGWSVFGQSVEVSHAVLIPFVWGLLIQLFRLCEHYSDRPAYVFLLFLLLAVDPTLDAQFILVSPEAIQLFFFLLAFNAYLRGERYMQVVAMAFLGIVSYRGMMLCGGLFLFEVIDQWFQSDNKSGTYRALALNYALAAIPAITYLAVRWHVKGWWYTHPQSPWAAYSVPVDFLGFVRNMIVLAHRYLDFGRVFVWIVLAFLLVRKQLTLDTKNRQLLLAAVTVCVIIVVASVRVTNPMGHRYFIASYLFLALLAGRALLQSKFSSKKWLLGGLITALVSGNLWVYPSHIAQGWDASLAVIPYFGLRQQAISYLDEQRIPVNQTGTFSPNATEIHLVDLNGDRRALPPFNGTQPYVLYSNVYNLSDEELSILSNEYALLTSWASMQVTVQLFARKTYTNPRPN